MALNRAPDVSESGENEEDPRDGPGKVSLCMECEAREQSQALLRLRGACTHRYGLRYPLR